MNIFCQHGIPFWDCLDSNCDPYYQNNGVLFMDNHPIMDAFYEVIGSSFLVIYSALCIFFGKE